MTNISKFKGYFPIIVSKCQELKHENLFTSKILLSGWMFHDTNWKFVIVFTEIVLLVISQSFNWSLCDDKHKFKILMSIINITF